MVENRLRTNCAPKFVPTICSKIHLLWWTNLGKGSNNGLAHLIGFFFWNKNQGLCPVAQNQNKFPGRVSTGNSTQIVTNPCFSRHQTAKDVFLPKNENDDRLINLLVVVIIITSTFLGNYF